MGLARRNQPSPPTLTPNPCSMMHCYPLYLPPPLPSPPTIATAAVDLPTSVRADPWAADSSWEYRCTRRVCRVAVWIFAPQARQHFLLIETKLGCMPVKPGLQRSRTMTGLNCCLYNWPLHLHSCVSTRTLPDVPFIVAYTCMFLKRAVGSVSVLTR